MIFLTKSKFFILKLAPILSVVMIFFIFGHNVLATNVIDQQSSGSSGTIGPNTDAYAQSFIATQNNINQFVLARSCNAGDYATTTVNWFLCAGDLDLNNSSFQINYACNNIGNNLIYASSSQLLCNSNFPSVITLFDNLQKIIIPGIKYYISWKPETSHLKFTYTTINYPYGDGMNLLTNRDFLFYEYYDNSISSSSQSIAQITIANPQNGLTYQNFSNWQLDYGIASTNSPSSTYNIVVQYGIGTSTTEWTDNENVIYSENLTRWAISKSHNFGDGIYYARAYLYQDGNLIAYSLQNAFIIDNTNGIKSSFGFENPNYAPPNTMSTTTPTDCNFKPVCDGLDTGTIGGYTECAFRGAINWATCPSVISLSTIVQKQNMVKQLAPFSVYYDIMDTVKLALASTTTSTDQTIGVPMYNINGTSSKFMILPVISSSTMPNAMGQGNYNLIRSSIGFVMWICLAFIIYLILR